MKNCCFCFLFAGAHVSAASHDADVDTRVATPLPTLAGTGIAGWFTLVPTEHSSEQRALFHPLRGQPRPIRVRARAQGYLQQVRERAITSFLSIFDSLRISILHRCGAFFFFFFNKRDFFFTLEISRALCVIYIYMQSRFQVLNSNLQMFASVKLQNWRRIIMKG